MIRRWWDRLGAASAVRKGAVLLATVLGGGFVVVRLAQGADFFGSFMRGAGIAFAVMVVVATAHNPCAANDVEETELAGARVRFGAARRAVGAVERRLDAHTRATDQRLLDR